MYQQNIKYHMWVEGNKLKYHPWKVSKIFAWRVDVLKNSP